MMTIQIHSDILLFHKHVYKNALRISTTGIEIWNSVFPESAHWADSVIESQCPDVCLCVKIQNTLFRRSWRPLVEGCIANIGLQ